MARPRATAIAPYLKGIAAGTAATLAVSILIVLKRSLAIPGADLIAVFAELAGGFGLPETRAVGWTAHILTGTLAWGLVFGFVAPRVAGDPAIKGIFVGVLIWVATVFVIFPLLGAGFAGLGTGQTTPAVMLVMHLAYGSVLGGAYDLLRFLERRRAPDTAAR